MIEISLIEIIKNFCEGTLRRSSDHPHPQSLPKKREGKGSICPQGKDKSEEKEKRINKDAY